ncbi:MAG: hypothetical protein M1365_01075 [Actinobacteria bacterium]|nr:hypothetical protein [Actinomycetota bacterium]
MKTQNERWISAQLWANNHTDKQCSFLVPFETQGFRVYSKRPITGDYKDGTLSFYSPIIAQDWNKRRTDLGNWENFNLINLEKLQKEYHFSFMVSHVKTNFNLPIMYKNDEFIIYQMPQREEDCRVI